MGHLVTRFKKTLERLRPREFYTGLRGRALAHCRRDDPIAITCAVVAALLIGAGGWFTYNVFRGLPSPGSIRDIANMAEATTLFDTRDRPAFTLYQERRLEVPLTEMSPHLVRAILAIEDQRFYDHSGVDVVRVAGAALRNIRERRAAEGGSTITQQLARQTLLTTDKTLRRKAREAIVARRIERAFSKDQILEMYLNKVYFGDGLYGAEAASLGFFGKHARDLNVAEAALLAGLVKSPSSYAPDVSMEKATARRAIVLQAMREARFLDAAEYRAAMKAPVKLVDVLRQEESYGQYFREEVRKQLVDLFGVERVYEGGLRVYTTIDLDMQKAAESEVHRALAEIDKRQAHSRRKGEARDEEPLQAALVALDPRTGEVRAMVGGRDFGQSRFNRATQAKRQPGSAFKPFVYAAAIERGYTPAWLITNLSAPIHTLQGAWSPEDEHIEGDAITMRAALRTSSNRAAVRMLQDVGIPETVGYAKRFGLGLVPSVPSLALGSGEVTLLSMTAAFATFANEGLRPTPFLVRRVESAEGELLYETKRQAEPAVSEATAFLMTSMLQDVINSGTAWPARREGFRLPAAGKTGTTNEYKDVWFVGYTPKLVAGVWVGYDQPKTIVSRGYAADLAVPLWGRFMKAATAHDEPLSFRPPPGLVGVNICRISGKLAADGCRDAVVLDKDGLPTRKSTVYTEYFVRGTEPFEECTVHTVMPGIIGTLGQASLPEPVPPPPASATTSAPPEAAVATTAVPPPATPTTEATPTKKRGFWGRIFRRGGGDNERKE